MKVLVVGPINSPIVSRLVNHLKSQGIEVLIASHGAIESEGVVNLGELNSFWNYLNFFKINKIVNKYNPDLVHAHVVNHYGLMCLLQPKPLLVALWGSDILLAPHTGNVLKKLAYRCINWLVLKKATRCHTSAYHVADEAEKQCKGVLQKTDVFYWGFPLDKPSDEALKSIEKKMAEEFGAFDEGLVVFPRGLATVYNPKMVAKIINKLLLKTQLSNKIVVLKGFASCSEEKYFKSLVDLSLVTYINRLLTSDELYFLYNKSDIHFSIPVSDSLGGGVVEPALFGSYPVLSNLPSYRKYSKQNKSIILENYESNTLEMLCGQINSKKIGKSLETIPAAYTLPKVLSNIVDTYQKTQVSG